MVSALPRRAALLAALATARLLVGALPLAAQAEGNLLAPLTSSALREKVGFHAVDLASGAVLASHDAERLRHPASNAKLLTAYAALVILGPAHRFVTRVYGDLDTNGTAKGLTLVGDGDPALTGSDLSMLARRLRDRGLRRVDGLWVDAGRFGETTLPSGFEAQPEENGAFRASIGGIAIDRGAYRVDVRAGGAAGALAQVVVDAPGYVVLTSEVRTTAKGPPVIRVAQRADGSRLRVLVSGTIATGAAWTGRQRVDDARWHAAHRFAEALRRVGVEVRGEPMLGPAAGARGALLTSHESPQVGALVAALGKESDNFTAEMLACALAPGPRTPCTAAGVERVRDAVAERGVRVGAMVLTNGSGLFGASRISPRTLTDVLRVAASDPRVGPEYVAHLAVAGVDGTLAERRGVLPADDALGRVRAKTGTLRDVVALSGYVLDARGRPAVAFAFFANGVEGQVPAARALADALVNGLARHAAGVTAPERR